MGKITYLRPFLRQSSQRNAPKNVWNSSCYYTVLYKAHSGQTSMDFAYFLSRVQDMHKMLANQLRKTIDLLCKTHWSALRSYVVKYTVRQRATLNSHHPLLSTIHKIHVF